MEGGREGLREKGMEHVVCLPQTAREDPGIHSGGEASIWILLPGPRNTTCPLLAESAGLKNNRAILGHRTSGQ